MNKTTFGTVLSVLIAEVSPLANKVYEMHVPPVVMEVFQCVAWGSAGVMAFVWVIRLIKGHNEDGN